MEHPPDQQVTMEVPPSRGVIVMENLPQDGMKESLGFDTDQPEDRWLWFTVRLSLVLFMIGVEVVVIAAFAKIMLGL
jgi:hypothetical protein